MYEVRDTVVLLTGGAAGIGAGIARAFIEEGAKHVAALDVDVKSGEALEKELTEKHGPGKYKFHKCDVTTSELDAAFDSVMKEFGYIDVVINCAGIMNDDPKVYVKEINVNVTALITSSFKAYEIMRKDHGGKGGTIVNIASVIALFHGTTLPVYAATKSAVLQFTTCLGLEPHYDRSGVRTVTICFGCTDTSLFSSAKLAAFDKETNDEIEAAKAELPMQKPESAVKGFMEAYKKGKSASTWMITTDRAAEDITDNITKGYEIMSKGVFD